MTAAKYGGNHRLVILQMRGQIFTRATFMSSDNRLDLEFAYTRYQDSCRDLYSPHYYCRRPIGHEGVHAAGFGSSRLRWEHEPDHAPHMLS